MADPVAIISVASSATVAVLAPFLTGRNEQRRLLMEHKKATDDERRAVLDEAAVQLWDLIAATEAVIPWGGSPPRENKDQFDAAVKAATRSSARLTIRFLHGSDLSDGFRQSIDACVQARHLSGSAGSEPGRMEAYELVAKASSEYDRFADAAVLATALPQEHLRPPMWQRILHRPSPSRKTLERNR